MNTVHPDPPPNSGPLWKMGSLIVKREKMNWEDMMGTPYTGASGNSSRKE